MSGMRATLARWYWQWHGQGHVRFGRDAWLHPSAVALARELVLEDGARLSSPQTRLDGRRIVIGRHSYAGRLAVGGTEADVEIGRYVSIADDVALINGPSWHAPGRLSTFPFGHVPAFDDAAWRASMAAAEATAARECRPLRIGHDVWIGRRALVLSSVGSIGHGAVIGAGAVVTKDVPPYAIVAGVPAEVVRYRFAPPVIDALLALRWWDWPAGQVRAQRALFAETLGAMDPAAAWIRLRTLQGGAVPSAAPVRAAVPAGASS